MNATYRRFAVGIATYQELAVRAKAHVWLYEMGWKEDPV